MALPPQVMQYQMDHIHENRAPAAITVISVFAFLALVCVVVRIFSRVKSGGLGLDDYLMIVGAVFTFCQVLTVYELSHWGLGKHLIAVPSSNFGPIGKWTAVAYFTYPAAIAFVKWSILALIARVFTLNKKMIKWGVWVLAIYTFLWVLGLYLADGLACKPFSSLWSTTAPCELPWKVTEISSILDIVADFAIVILPQSMIWSLQMSLRKKIAVSTLMALGVFCSITGIVRIVVAKSTTATDSTFQTIPLIFVCLEPIVGVICGCLPTMHGAIYGAFMAARDTISLLSDRSRTRISGSKPGSGGSGNSRKDRSFTKLGDSDPTTDRITKKATYDEESQAEAGSSIPLHEIRKKTVIEVTRDDDDSTRKLRS